MKKIALIAASALMVSALSITAAATEFKAASGTAKIDGVMDDAYKAAQEIKIDQVLSGNGKTTGTARTIWDDKNIYVFFDITDPLLSAKYDTAHCYDSDSVEFFIDLSGQPLGANIMQVNAAQYTAPAPIDDAPTNTWSGRGKHWDANKAGATYKGVKTDKGWTLEMQIPFGADYTPKADAKINVVYHINSDEDGKSPRDGEVFAGKGQDQAWDKTANYDSLVLTSAKYEAPKPQQNQQTADLGLIAAVASLVSGAAAIGFKKRK